MSLSDLHNPKAAAALIKRFQARFNLKTCMAPGDEHFGAIVSAHTLSVEAMLRKIAVHGHVFAPVQAKKISTETFPIQIERRGLRDVSVFNGFCQKHDRDLFSCLETEPFRFTRQQTFMLAYRAASRECYLKRKQYESLPTAEQIAEVHGIEEELQLSEIALLFQASTLSGAEDAETLKAALDSRLLAQSWDRLVTRAILFPKLPSILATGAFQPFFDMNGNQLQDFENFEEKMSQICISLIPIDSGGAAIFSWLDSSNSAPERFFNSVASQPNLTSAVMHSVLDNTENIAINPTWYESLGHDEKRYLLSRVTLFEAGSDYASMKQRGVDLQALDDWGAGIASIF
jgi:hypothetical protein